MGWYCQICDHIFSFIAGDAKMEVHLIYDPKRFVVKFYKWLTEEISDGCRFSRVDEGLSFITLISSRTSEITNRRARSWHGDQGHLD